MSDLIFRYLLIIIMLFSANIGLFFGNFKFNNKKSTLISLVMGIILFVIIYISSQLTINLLDYLSYIFILVSIIIFITLFVYLKKQELKISLFAIIITYYAVSMLFSSQLGECSLFNYLLLFFVSVIVMIISFQSSKLLMYARRPYNVIIGEYMSLMGILIFIFGLTNNSVVQLNYKMFSSFLILTPTFQLIYVIIGIIFVFVIGFYLDDKRGNL